MSQTLLNAPCLSAVYAASQILSIAEDRDEAIASAKRAQRGIDRSDATQLVKSSGWQAPSIAERSDGATESAPRADEAISKYLAGE